MPINFQQTDTSASTSDQPNCSGASLVSGGFSLSECSAAGAAGSNTISGTLPSSATQSYPAFRCVVAGGVTWAAGTWTVRFNVQTANMNLTVTEVYVCRADSSNVNQATIGSATGLSISLGTTGVKTQAVTGASQTPAANDAVFIVLVIVNAAMTSQTIILTPNQLIDSPFTEPAGYVRPKIVNVSQAVNRASTY